MAAESQTVNAGTLLKNLKKKNKPSEFFKSIESRVALFERNVKKLDSSFLNFFEALDELKEFIDNPHLTVPNLKELDPLMDLIREFKTNEGIKSWMKTKKELEEKKAYYEGQMSLLGLHTQFTVLKNKACVGKDVERKELITKLYNNVLNPPRNFTIAEIKKLDKKRLRNFLLQIWDFDEKKKQALNSLTDDKIYDEKSKLLKKLNLYIHLLSPKESIQITDWDPRCLENEEPAWREASKLRASIKAWLDQLDQLSFESSELLELVTDEISNPEGATATESILSILDNLYKLPETKRKILLIVKGLDSKQREMLDLLKTYSPRQKEFYEITCKDLRHYLYENDQAFAIKKVLKKMKVTNNYDDSELRTLIVDISHNVHAKLKIEFYKIIMELTHWHDPKHKKDEKLNQRINKLALYLTSTYSDVVREHGMLELQIDFLDKICKLIAKTSTTNTSEVEPEASIEFMRNVSIGEEFLYNLAVTFSKIEDLSQDEPYANKFTDEEKVFLSQKATPRPLTALPPRTFNATSPYVRAMKRQLGVVLAVDLEYQLRKLLDMSRLSIHAEGIIYLSSWLDSKKSASVDSVAFEKITFQYSQFSDKDSAEELLDFFRINSFWRGIDLGYLRLNEDETANLISVIGEGCTELRELCLDGFVFGEESSKSLSNLIQNAKKLERLSLERVILHQTTMRLLVSALQNNTSLHHLNLNHNYISSDTAKALLEMLESNKTLTSIKLKSNKQVDDILSHGINSNNGQNAAKRLLGNTAKAEITPVPFLDQKRLQSEAKQALISKNKKWLEFLLKLGDPFNPLKNFFDKEHAEEFIEKRKMMFAIEVIDRYIAIIKSNETQNSNQDLPSQFDEMLNQELELEKMTVTQNQNVPGPDYFKKNYIDIEEEIKEITQDTSDLEKLSSDLEKKRQELWVKLQNKISIEKENKHLKAPTSSHALFYNFLELYKKRKLPIDFDINFENISDNLSHFIFDINYKYEEDGGNSLLHIAYTRQDCEYVDLLLQYDADFLQTNGTKKCVLDLVLEQPKNPANESISKCLKQSISILWKNKFPDDDLKKEIELLDGLKDGIQGYYESNLSRNIKRNPIIRFFTGVTFNFELRKKQYIQFLKYTQRASSHGVENEDDSLPNVITVILNDIDKIKNGEFKKKVIAPATALKTHLDENTDYKGRVDKIKKTYFEKFSELEKIVTEQGQQLKNKDDEINKFNEELKQKNDELRVADQKVEECKKKLEEINQDLKKKQQEIEKIKQEVEKSKREKKEKKRKNDDNSDNNKASESQQGNTNPSPP